MYKIYWMSVYLIEDFLFKSLKSRTCLLVGLDTLILYRNKDVGVSTVVLEAYEDYRTMQPPNEELSITKMEVHVTIR